MVRMIFISGLVSFELESELEENTKLNFQLAANTLSNSILKGLKYWNDNIFLLSAPLIGSFPSTYRKMFFRGKRFDLDFVEGFCSSSINLPLVKLLTKYFSLKKYIDTIDISKEKVYIIVYGMHTPYLMSAVYYKKKNPDSKICLIIPDLSCFMSSSKNPIYLFFKNIDIYYQKRILADIDSFVFLSEQMNDYVNRYSKPYLVIEGVYDGLGESFKLGIKSAKDKKNVIMYSGSLDRRYGILDLLDAFSGLKDCYLWICGDGDMKKAVIERTRMNPSITYYGQLSRSKVLAMQKEAKILVNPRTSTGKYTQYSFPSKTIEYMISGTPCVMRKLPTIPPEYEKYLFFTSDDSVLALELKLKEVLEMQSVKLDIFALAAAKFIVENKNYLIQGNKIMKMMDDL